MAHSNITQRNKTLGVRSSIQKKLLTYPAALAYSRYYKEPSMPRWHYEMIIKYLKRKIEQGHYEVLFSTNHQRTQNVFADVFIHSPPHLLQKYGLNPDEEWYFIIALKREDVLYENGSFLPKILIKVYEEGFWRFMIRTEVFDPNAPASEGRKLVGHKYIYHYHHWIGKPGAFCLTKWIMVMHISVLPAAKSGAHIVTCKILNCDGVRRSARMGTRIISPQAAEEMEMFEEMYEKEVARVGARGGRSSPPHYYPSTQSRL